MSIATSDVKELINELEEIVYLLECDDIQAAYDELENQQGTIATLCERVEELL